MLDPQQREKLERHVRPILVRYIERSEECHSDGRSNLPILLRQIQHNVPPPPLDVTRRSTIGDLQAWVLTVAWALAFVGPMASRVVLWRLTRRTKSKEAAWETIAKELNALGYDVVIADAKQMFEIALPILSEVFDQIGITIDVHNGSRSSIVHAIDQCAAIAANLPCPMQPAIA